MQKSIFFSNLEILVKLLIKKGFRFKHVVIFFKLIILLKLRLRKIKKNEPKVYKKYKLYRKNPLLFIINVAKKVYPSCRFLKLYLSGKKYSVPAVISAPKQKHIAYKWLVKNSKKRVESTVILRLSGEIIDTFLGISETCRIWEEQYILAYENKQFLNYMFKRKKNRRKGKIKISNKPWVSIGYHWRVKKLLKKKIFFGNIKNKILRKLSVSDKNIPLLFRNISKYSKGYKKSKRKMYWIGKNSKKKEWTFNYSIGVDE